MNDSTEEEEWIETPGGWNNEGGTSGKDQEDIPAVNKNDKDEEDEEENGMFMMDMFVSHDPRDTFRFDLLTSKKCDDTSRVEDRDISSLTAATPTDSTAQNTNTTAIKLHGFALESDETAKSTGVTLWQAAPRLAKFLMMQQLETQHTANIDDNPALNNGLKINMVDSTVLELGAGLGLCGIVAHHLGASRVVITDGDTQALKQMRENVRDNPIPANNVTDGGSDDVNNDDGGQQKEDENGDDPTTTASSIECRQLLWGSQAHMQSFESTYGRFDLILGADVIYTPESTGPLFDTVVDLLKHDTGRFVLSRFNKWNDVSDEVVLEAANARGLGCTRPDDGIFVFSFLSDDA